jgi:hypothetical protein
MASSRRQCVRAGPTFRGLNRPYPEANRRGWKDSSRQYLKKGEAYRPFIELAVFAR